MKQKLLIVPLLASALIACGSSTLKSTEKPKEKPSQVMVVTANPHATNAGLEVLRRGGSAVDAAVAIEAVLSLVEPQSSGLAGGGFMVHFDAQTKSMAVYDGRETAPAGATPDMFLDENGKRMGFLQAKNSGLSTGAPGMLAMLSLAHKEQGTLPWNTLFSHAKTLAKEGFEISPRLYGMLERYGKYVPKTEEEGPTDAYRYFFAKDGTPLPAGHILTNLAYAESLEIIAGDVNEFYQGNIAQQIAAMVQQSPRPGTLTAEDIASYKSIKRQALCQPYRDMQICGAPPPSSWMTVGMIMSQLEKSPGFSAQGADDPLNWSLFVQSQQLAYADRDRFVADPDFVTVPIEGMLNEEYLASRAKLMTAGKAMSKLEPGDPWAYNSIQQANTNGIDASYDVHGTTHFVVVDAQGDVVSMTATVESIFGTTRMVGGMFLNNELTDFSFLPVDKEGRAIVNAIAPGKRPRSSMSPTIVLDKQGKFLMATGSPGGNNIIAYPPKTLVGVFDWGLRPQQAADLPNVVARGQTVRLEKDLASDSLIEAMKSYGFKVDASRGENSGISIILRKPDGSLEGGVDKRREGVIGTY
jgi:gamma-glutamyltranspeptidase/glutathione hydrolase